jgi:hypothetical protein
MRLITCRWNDIWVCRIALEEMLHFHAMDLSLYYTGLCGVAPTVFSQRKRYMVGRYVSVVLHSSSLDPSRTATSRNSSGELT